MVSAPRDEIKKPLHVLPGRGNFDLELRSLRIVNGIQWMPDADGAPRAPRPRGLVEAAGFSFLGRGDAMGSQKLFELLLSRLAAQDAPPYLGEFRSRAALPRRLPPIFAWLDLDGVVHLNTSRTALALICIHESISAGQPEAFGSPAVAQAVDRFRDVAATTWAATKIEQAPACSELKSARQRASLRWGTTR